MEHPKKIALVFGTRPEAVKLAPVFRALKADPRLDPVLWLTGQHKEMVAR
jgi:UDP-N-acetylglucosamine 2-epimerase (non-hydrolysing)